MQLPGTLGTLLIMIQWLVNVVRILLFLFCFVAFFGFAAELERGFWCAWWAEMPLCDSSYLNEADQLNVTWA